MNIDELLKKIAFELDAFLDGGYYPNAHITLNEVLECIEKRKLLATNKKPLSKSKN